TAAAGVSGGGFTSEGRSDVCGFPLLPARPEDPAADGGTASTPTGSVIFWPGLIRLALLIDGLAAISASTLV
ncbi:hypothetical protein, partial [Enterobacter hormaechei]|uniref:hypothetical protein n=1 Tax=Enterobacter hormaechei TaxID=158836 RepID=UPI00203B1470